MDNKKTWARETSFAMIVGLAVLAYGDKIEQLEILVWPVTVFSLAAFGFQQPTVSDWMRSRGK